MGLILITVVGMGLAVLAMSVGVLLSGRCLRGSCGGPELPTETRTTGVDPEGIGDRFAPKIDGRYGGGGRFRTGIRFEVRLEDGPRRPCDPGGARDSRGAGTRREGALEEIAPFHEGRPVSPG